MAASLDYFYLDIEDPERINALSPAQLREMVAARKIAPTVIVVNEQTGESGHLNEFINLKAAATGTDDSPAISPFTISLTTAVGLILLGTMVAQTVISGLAIGDMTLALRTTLVSKVSWVDAIAGVSLLLGNLLPPRWMFILKIRFVLGMIVAVIGFVGAPFLSKFFVWADLSGAAVAALLGSIILYNLGMLLAVNHHGAAPGDDQSRGWNGVKFALGGMAIMLAVYGYWGYTGELRHAFEKMVRQSAVDSNQY